MAMEAAGIHPNFRFLSSNGLNNVENEIPALKWQQHDEQFYSGDVSTDFINFSMDDYSHVRDFATLDFLGKEELHDIKYYSYQKYKEEVQTRLAEFREIARCCIAACPPRAPHVPGRIAGPEQGVRKLLRFRGQRETGRALPSKAVRRVCTPNARVGVPELAKIRNGKPASQTAAAVGIVNKIIYV